MAPFERGTKRQCQHCGTKFYDLARDPILCPHCGKQFLMTAARPARVFAEEKPEVEEVEVEVAAEKAGVEVVSLDDADETEEETAEEIPEVEDVEVEADIGEDDDDAFLEEDEDDEEIDFNVPGDRDDA